MSFLLVVDIGLPLMVVYLSSGLLLTYYTRLAYYLDFLLGLPLCPSMSLILLVLNWFSFKHFLGYLYHLGPIYSLKFL